MENFKGVTNFRMKACARKYLKKERMKMKKRIVFATVIAMFLSYQSVSAQDFFITDINAEYHTALTSDGYVFQAKDLSKSEKSLIKEGVAALTNEKDVFLMKDGSVDFKGKFITGLNVEEIVYIYDDAFRNKKQIVYRDKASAMHIYDCENEQDSQIIENVSEAKVLRGDLYIKTNSNELYYYSKENLQFVASDVCDYTAYHYLKNNGDLYYFNPNNKMSTLIMHEVDIWQGIPVGQEDREEIVVYQNGWFRILNKDKCIAEYTAPRGVNDILKCRSDILYIGKDNLLYFLDIHSYYGYFETGKEREFCLSDTIHFSRLYYANMLVALDVNNNLYTIHQKEYKTSSGSNYTGIYENINVYLGKSIANAVLNKSDYSSSILITTQNGVCYSLENGELLYNTFNNKNINLLVNKKSITLSAPIQMVEGRTMYPLRECFNAMGASVQWDGERQVATGEVSGIKIEFPIGKNEYYINGVRHEMDAAAYVDESIGRTYIPIRYAAEGLGFTVDWIAGDLENTIDIHK